MKRRKKDTASELVAPNSLATHAAYLTTGVAAPGLSAQAAAVRASEASQAPKPGPLGGV